MNLEPAAQRLAALVAGVSDDMLGAPTPCRDFTVGDLMDHISSFAVGFTAVANKTTVDGDAARPPAPDAARLVDDWRGRIANELLTLAEAWRDPAAWTGMTKAAGIDFPGEVAGLIALDEVVVHGWDVARATGASFDAEPGALEALHGFLVPFTADVPREGIFGPRVPVPDDAPLLDRVLGLTGRNPGWSPAP